MKNYQRFLTLVPAFALAAAACGGDDGENNQTDTGTDTDVGVDTEPDVPLGIDCENDDCISVHQPVWTAGERWLVASLYRLGQAKTPEWLDELSSQPALDGIAELTPPEGWEPDADESWGSPIVWEFLVVGAGITPDADSPLVDYAVTGAGEAQSLSILRVTAPTSINPREVIEGLDPTFYVIIGDADGHARSVHFDYRVASGLRNTVVLELPTSGDERAVSANHDLFVVPYLMPSFPLEEGNYEAVVGAGTILDEVAVDASAADATVEFRTQPDGRLVRQFWQDGAAWFDVSATPDRISWVISPSEIPGGLDDNKSLIPKDNHELEDAQTIADKFRSPIRLSDAYQLAPGSFEAGVPQEFEPWAGYWWPLSDAPTAFGWSRGARQQHDDMPSIVLREMVREQLSEKDRLGESLRELERGSDEWNTARDRYFEIQDEVRTAVWEYTDGLAERFQNGEIDLANIDDFSPLTKWGIYLMANKLSEHPFEALAWEVIKQYNPVGGSWWGKCNGWAAAAILTNEPREELTLQIPAESVGAEGDAISVPFESGDIKSMVSGVYYSTMSHFYGARYSDEEDDLSDLHAHAFHRIITYYIGEEKFPLVFDTTATEAVWNYPAYAYSMTIDDAGVADEGLVSINTARVTALEAVEGVSSEQATVIARRLLREGRVENMSDLLALDGVEQETVDALGTAFSVHGERHEWAVATALIYSTDGVSEDHLDVIDGDPEGFTKNYTYSLFTDADGNVTDGEWTGGSVEDHPDFAWVPYANNARRASQYDRYSPEQVRQYLYDGRNAPNENPFLFTDVMDRLVDVRVNAPVVCNPEPDDCPTGFVCNPVDGSCVEDSSPAPSCAGGEKEAPLALVAGELADQAICEGRDAWFSVSLNAGDRLDVTIEFPHADGDIDLEAASPAGDIIASSTSTSDSESVGVTATVAGDYLVRIYGYNGAHNTVSIDTKIEAAAAPDDLCGDEANEPNDTFENATVISGGNISGNICAAGELDHFIIDGSDAVQVTVEFVHAEGDLDVKVLNAAGESIGSSAGTSDSEVVEATGGDVIQVYGYRDATGLFSVTVAPAP